MIDLAGAKSLVDDVARSDEEEAGEKEGSEEESGGVEDAEEGDMVEAEDLGEVDRWGGAKGEEAAAHGCVVVVLGGRLLETVDG